MEQERINNITEKKETTICQPEAENTHAAAYDGNKSIKNVDFERSQEKKKADSKDVLKKKIIIVIAYLIVAVIVFVIVKSVLPRTGSCVKIEQTTAEYLNSQGLELSENNYVVFGRYEQDAISEEAEPIEWIPLGVNEGKLLLLSRYALDMTTRGLETWEESESRKWLNNEFLHTAFDTEERQMIVEVENDNPIVLDPNKLKIAKKGENPTTDKVFLLNILEVETYLSDMPERYTEATEYAKIRGAFVADNGNTWWTLRSTDSNFVGAESGYGLTASTAVRPAIWINLD